MSGRARPLVSCCLAALVLAGCGLGGAASDDGQALLVNGTGEQGLRVVVSAPDGVRLEDGLLEAVYSFDVQWVERDLQCYVATDGAFEVLRPDGEVVVRHEFADRQVCEREEITLEADGDLVWSS